MSDPARTLAAFIPQDRRRALAGGPPVADRERGATAFADLSGFTVLTERLANRLGPLRGAEELGAWLRRIFDPMIACVEAEGGSVLGFAGDAITCFFPGDDGSRAVRAAERMQQEVARLHEARAADGERVGVRLKVAIAVGEVRRFVVGDPARRSWDVMAGATLVRTAAMEESAKPGEVIVDAAAARAAGREPIELRGDAYVLRAADDAVGAGGGDGSEAGAGSGEGADAEATAAPEVAPSGADAYRDHGVARPADDLWPDVATASPWAPEVARERVAHGAAPMGDFRPAGAVFLSFGGIDWDGDPQAGERLDLFLRHVQRELDAAGGTLVQVTVGDKGSYLYAAFGAPRAHGDDARRAVACAMRLVSARGPEIGRVDGLRAGVTYGAMYTGAYGGATRTTYGVLGPKTNLAARLMKRAGVGEVLCDPEAARRSRRAIRFSALPAETFKGVGKPVALHRAEREATEEERGATPMFGRDAERIDASGLIVQLRHGEGGYLRYEGEAGIGKSRLLTWIAEAAVARGVQALRGTAQGDGSEAGYALWRAPFAQLLDLPEGPAADAVREALARRGQSADGATVAAMTSLLTPGGVEGTRDGAARREAVAGAALATLDHALAQGPLLFLLDDVHRIDERSRDLLGRIAQRMRDRPLGVVAVGRPTSAAAAESLDAHLPGPARRLSGLEAEESRMLIAGALSVPAMAVPYPVATAIHERAGGVPVLVEEIVRDLVERDALRAERSWQGVGRGARGRAPNRGEVRVTFDEAALRDLEGGLDALLLARIDRLSISERTAMKTAAVVGRTAEHDPLAHLLESDPAALDAALTPLESPDMLEALSGAHRFQQTVLHDAAYENLLFEQRRTLHRGMSAWYLQRLQAGEEVDPARMAYHFFHATEGEDDPELVRPALAALESLAERHRAAGAHDEALAALKKADRLVPDGALWDADRARIAIRAGSLHERMGRHGRARDRFRSAVEAAQRAGDAGQEAEAQSGLALLALHLGELDEARSAAEGARDLAEAAGDDAALAGAALTAARVAETAGDLSEAIRQARIAVAGWERLGDEEASLPARIHLGRSCLAAGDVDEAERWLTPALAAAEAAGRPYLEALAGFELGEIARRRGRPEEAEARFTRSLSVFETHSAAREAILAARALAGLALDAGRLVDADRRFTEAFDAARELGATPHLVAAAVGRARIAWIRGHAGWAIGIVEAARHHPSLDPETERVVREVRSEILDRLGAQEASALAAASVTMRVEDARDAPTSQATRFGRGGRR